MIIPSTVLKPVGSDHYYIKGFPGFNNGIDELNNISAIYGTGKGAVSARSLNLNDIEKILGITEEMKKNSNNDYGTEIVAKSGTWIDGTTIDSSNPKKGVDLYYDYYPVNDGILTTDDPLYKLVFVDDTDSSVYLLANQIMWTNMDFNFSLAFIGWNYLDTTEGYMVDTKNSSCDDMYRSKASCNT